PILVELLVEMETLEDELDRGRHQPWTLERTQLRDGLAQARDLLYALPILRRRHAVGHLDAPAGLEVLCGPRECVHRERAVPDREHGAADQAVDQLLRLLVLARVLELDLPRRGREDGVQVGEPRDDLALAGAERALLGVTGQ